MILDRVNSPEELKKISVEECNQLAEEIRNVIITKLSQTGGHLSSNLGIVEATIALHYVFESPTDKFVFDTSHQCYTHKILTGRKDGFVNSELYGKYTGYTNPKESEHDFVEVGHTSTSISIAVGLAKARDLAGDDYNVVAVIGDGSLGGGQALEALNFAGSELEGKFMVLVNDNEMSIAEDHGGLYLHLEELRKTGGQSNNNIFKALGYDYIYVEDGHSVEKLVESFKTAKELSRPVVVHIHTVKGKGLSSAEKYKEDSHWVKSFDLEEGVKPVRVRGDMERYDRIIRDHIIERMKADPMIVAMTAAMPNALSYDVEIREQLGKQYIDAGICEPMAISMAAGIAKNGGKPVFATRSTFIQRTYDQLSQELGINQLPVTIILVNASIYAPTDVTHIGIFDITMISNIPNIVYLCPTNKQEYIAMVDWSIDQTNHPVVIRAPRNGVFDNKYGFDTNYDEINKFQVCKKGEKVAVIAAGDFFQLGDDVVDILENELGVKASLINPRFVSGVDEQILSDLEKQHRIVITLEDGILEGGFGQKVAAYYADTKMRVMTFGFEKKFRDYHDTEKLLCDNKLTSEQIVKEISCLLKEIELCKNH